MRVAALCLVLSACAPSWKQLPHDQLYQHAPRPVLHEIPAEATLSDWWDKTLNSTIVPLAHVVSPAFYVRELVGGRPALDVNAFGEVPDSTWFQNRITKEAIPPAVIERELGNLAGPADGPLTVVSGKLAGATPGLVARDAEGTLWFVKFDPPAHPELSTGAEVVAGRLLGAAGYHVPDLIIEDIAVTRFQLAPDAFRRDKYNRRVKMTAEDLAGLLSNLNPDPEGRLRALFSRSVPGRPIGPFSYRGIRADDPNDQIPHERRRSLRGLWVLSAWLNNTDTRRGNTLDTFITVDRDRELGFIRHYLIDFGDALGASGDRVKYIAEGYEERVDWPELGVRFLALGLAYPYWLSVQRSPYRAVGVFEAEVFDPERWAPQYPNAAFEQATALDTFWGASILARFSREHIEAAVNAAKYSSPEVEAIIADVLMRRREKLLRYAFESVLPLDDPRVDNRYELLLTDLEVAAGLLDNSRYAWEVRWNRTRRPDRVLAIAATDMPRADLRQAIRKVMDADRDGFIRDPFLTVRFRRKGHPAAVEVHLRVAGKSIVPVALERQVAE